jgi:hypothetical protein
MTVRPQLILHPPTVLFDHHTQLTASLGIINSWQVIHDLLRNPVGKKIEAKVKQEWGKRQSRRVRVLACRKI